MPVNEFIDELKSLNYQPEVKDNNKVSFDYVVPEGRFKGQTIKIGFEVPLDWQITPPSGLHISPRILPINPNASGHPDRVAESSFGPEWEYWSRPFFPNWAETEKTVKIYLKHIRRLFTSIQ